MEVTALRLMINMWLLLQVQDSYCALKAAPSLRLSSDAAFLRVTPARLQHFEYKSVSFDCEGFDGELGLRVMKKSQNANTCSTNRNIQKGSLCTIETVYIDDSGEYWCETGDGKKSDTVNITVTAGSVILESPVHPVKEGDAVTLRCKNKTASSTISASFYKNGFLIKNSSADNMIIPSVSRSDEGLYRCSVSGSGESPQSRLTVRVFQKETIAICSDQLPVLLYLFVRIVGTMLWAALLLLVLRKRDSGKDRGK
ncbi:low affinity immunoglobulin gamma Fc region receptor II-a-like [Lates japonicus]